MSKVSISVVIPVINEEDQLPGLLQYLLKMPYHQLVADIIIADGGSTDQSVQIARSMGAVVVHSAKGRAVQMNNGVQAAKGNVLYFLHADTFPPNNAWKLIADAITRGIDAGCFRLSFNTTSRFLKINAWFTRFNINAIRFGDQSLFVKKEVFENIKGFDPKHIVLEDQDIIKRIRRQYLFKVLPFAVVTSDRKYRENGNVKLQTIFFIIYFLYQLGVPQPKLVSTYRRLVRKSNV